MEIYISFHATILFVGQQIQSKNCNISSNFNEDFRYNKNVTIENPPNEQQTQLVPIDVHVSIQMDEISAQKLQTKSMTNEEGIIR